MLQLELIRENLMECQKKENIKNKTKSDSNIAPSFVDHHQTNILMDTV